MLSLDNVLNILNHLLIPYFMVQDIL